MYSQYHEEAKQKEEDAKRKEEEAKMTTKLKDAIADLVTGRLYAAQAADSAQSFGTVAVRFFVRSSDFLSAEHCRHEYLLDKYL